MTQETDAISRRDFLKSFPQGVILALRSFTGKNFPINSFKEKTEDGNKALDGFKKAVINIEKCLAWQGLSCQLCYLACPLREQAITMNDQKPVISSLACDGCAMCAVACQTVNDLQAIAMVEHSTQRT